jgi:hypothetical protein
MLDSGVNDVNPPTSGHGEDKIDDVEVNDAPLGSLKAAGTWPSPVPCRLCERSKEEDDGPLLSRESHLSVTQRRGKWSGLPVDWLAGPVRWASVW